jgi:ADP-ribose pyrophosphatase
MADGKYERLSRKLVRQGIVIDEYIDTMSTPNGLIEEWDFIDHKGAAAVVPVMDDGRILMVNQYRNALERKTIELPAGGLKSREEPMKEAAARELEEETGYRCDDSDMEFLISVRTTVAFCNEHIDIYLARNLKPGTQNLDPDEFLNVKAYSVSELLNLIYAGKMEDGKTIAGILAYINKYSVKA